MSGSATVKGRLGITEAGLSLIELMVSLVIGLFLIIGAVTIYAQSRGAYRTIEASARVQEKARYALDVLEADIRMANYWGLNSRPDYIGAARDADPGQAKHQKLDALASVIDACGEDWAIDINEYVGGSNGNYNALADCDPSVGDAVAGADVLVIRRAGNERLTEVNSLRKDGLYIQTGRIKGILFSPTENCTPTDETCVPIDYQPPLSESHDLTAVGYFLSSASTGDPGQPSLRRKRLANGTNGATIFEEEVIGGIEDFQVQYGVDTDATPDGSADIFVNAGDAALGSGPVVAVRVWLRVRSDERDFTFFDPAVYQYAGMAAPADISDDDRRFRRVLVEQTIQLRNTRGYDQT